MSVELAITIDDLPVHGMEHPFLTREEIAEQIIAALVKHRVRACGFVNGGQTDPHGTRFTLRRIRRLPLGEKILQVLCNSGLIESRAYLSNLFPETKLRNKLILKRWVAAGQQLGNHQYWHSDINLIPLPTYLAGIRKTEKLINTLDQNHTKLFRYPYLREGSTTEQRQTVRAYLKENDYQIAQVTVDFRDWAWNRPYIKRVSTNRDEQIQTMKEAFLRVAKMRLQWSIDTADKLFGRPIKHILLLHMSPFCALVLDDLLSLYHADGVTFITVDEAVSDQLYTHDSGFLSAQGRTFLQQMLSSNHCT